VGWDSTICLISCSQFSTISSDVTIKSVTKTILNFVSKTTKLVINSPNIPEEDEQVYTPTNSTTGQASTSTDFVVNRSDKGERVVRGDDEKGEYYFIQHTLSFASDYVSVKVVDRFAQKNKNK
jgi:hypothetical protein